jgi:hypothetical protein
MDSYLIEKQKIIGRCLFFSNVPMGMIFLLLILGQTFAFAGTKLEIQVPDSKFERALIDLGIDTDRKVNGLITSDNLKNIKELNLSNKFIMDLTGIEAFTNLEVLDISNNLLEYIKISSLTQLKKLVCDHNKLRMLDIEDNVLLEFLACNDNDLSDLDLSTNSLITKVCAANNQLNNIEINQKSLVYLGLKNSIFQIVQIWKNLFVAIII